MDPGQFFTTYYKPFASLLSEQRGQFREVKGYSFSTFYIEPADLTIGVLSEILRADNMVRVPTILLKSKIDTIREPSPHSYIGSDGIFIELGKTWTEENMRKLPNDRTIREA